MKEKKETGKTYTPEEIAELRKKKWSELTYEEKRATLPKKLSKAGEMLLSGKAYLKVVDWDAVLQ
ncbi:MAG: hypothetical protein LUC23_01050 [Prevotellaceae bacterium]|nr:hypothetical protein [Prevotellaceae bacterium]